MSHKPVVSIIIPFLNPGAFFHEAVESVLRQSFKQWELLLVDDGSSDGSTHSARQFADSNPGRVRHLEHEGHRNLGQSAARNAGVRNAQGEYVAFLDADDVWFRAKLEQQVSILNARPSVAMVYGPDQWWYSWTNNPSDQKRDYVSPLGVPPDTIWTPPTLLIRSLQSKAPTPNPSSMMIRRAVIEKVGGFEEQFVGGYAKFEDQAFLAKVCLRFPVFATGECWYRYRQHGNSFTSTFTHKFKYEAAALYYCNWLSNYLKTAGIGDAELQEALGNRIWRHKHPVLFGLLGFWQGAVMQMKARARK